MIFGFAAIISPKSEKITNFDLICFLIFLVVLCSFIIGSIFFFIDKKIRPKKDMILLKELDKINLNKIGLTKKVDEINNEVYFTGNYRGYYINIGVLYTTTIGQKGEIRTNIFIEYDRKKIKKLDKKIELNFFKRMSFLTLINVLKKNEEIDSDKYYETLNELINYLIKEKIKPDDIDKPIV